MIISHRYKYLFVQLPRTGSTAIAKELRSCYEGEPILKKHSTYEDFLRVASKEEKKYFTFSCIRNPLDDAVSHYFKCKTDHKGNFTNPVRTRKRKGLANKLDAEIYLYLKETGADFPTFFAKYYRLPFTSWASLSHREFDFILRFENLSADFATVLKRIGIEPKRPLPVINRTADRDRSFVRYYSPEIIPRAVQVFGPYMQEWGYEFPPEWGEVKVPRWAQLEYRALTSVRSVYWKYLRYRI